MKQVINKSSNKRLGYLSSLDDIKDTGKRYMFEPFVRDHNFIVFIDDNGNFGLCSSENHEIVNTL